MPLNDYWCLRCGEGFESLSDREELPCPKCPYMAKRQLPRVAEPKVRGFNAENGYS